MKFIFLLGFSLVGLIAQSATLPIAELHGGDVITGSPVTPDLSQREGLVVVFLSAVCPCSNSHLTELAALAKEYSTFAFLGVHSNTDEQKEPTQRYFRNAALPFPTIQDPAARIADLYKALKTPHVFILRPDGAVAYQGGVSSSHDLARADRKYLREALEDLSKHRPVKTPEGRTLGCAIARGQKNDW